MIRSISKPQHDPTLLETGNILLFDNLGLGQRSQVIEFDPLTHDVVWRYKGSDDAPFFSYICSTAQRLPNGNTLATITVEARAIEVTPQGEIVWEFRNPDAVNPNANGGYPYASSLFEMRRIPLDYPLDWLSR